MLDPIHSALLAVLPYVHVPEGHIGFIPIHPFGLLVALGVIVGNMIASRRAQVLWLDPREFENLVFATVATGFVLSHVFDAIAYHPHDIVRDPLYLIEVWKGLSSFGGFLGAAIGFFVYTRRHKINPWVAADAINFGLPVGWFFGRMGCSSVHDHPGLASHSAFAVNWPLPLGGPRFDLGLLELMLTPILIIAAIAVGTRTTKPGRVTATVSLIYPCLRFPLDFLRLDDPQGGDVRYFGFTPGQYACVALFLFGLFVLYRTAKLPPPEAPPAKRTAKPAAGRSASRTRAAKDGPSAA